MKLKNTIAAAALAAVAIGSANATTVYVAGSSAFRYGVFDALTTASWTVVATSKSSKTDNSASQVLFNKGSDYISVNWNGSEAGVQSALSPQTNSAHQVSFYKDTATDVGSFSTKTNAWADIAFTDCSASSSRWNGLVEKAATKETDGNIYTYAKATIKNQVGVLPFTFLASDNIKDCNGNAITNMTRNAARVLFEKGNIPLSLLTGNSLDNTNGIWLFGRNPDSGSRIDVFTEVGYPGLSKTMNYYKVSDSNSVITKISAKLPNYVGLNGLLLTAGDDGESSGGTLSGTVAPCSNGLTVVGAATNSAYWVAYTNGLTRTVQNSALGSNSVWDGLANYTNNSLWTNTTVYGTNKAKGYTIALKAVGTVSTASTFSLTEYTYSWTNCGTNIPTAISKLAATKYTSGSSLTAPAANGDVVTNNNTFDYNGSKSPTGYYTVFSGQTNTPYSGGNYIVTYAMIKDAIGATNSLNGKSPAFLSYEGIGLGGTYPTNGTAFKGDEQTNAMNTMRGLCANGGYSLWAYETSILNPISGSNAAVSAIYSGLVSAISQLGTNIITPYQPTNSLNVTKAMEGAVIYNK